jgi:squalene-hopene/tetraprenyl-beta-curcumene cyclase
MVNSVMALKCLGYDDSHPKVAHGIQKLAELEIEEGDTIRLQPCLSPIWDTALAVTALSESGCSPDHPRIVAAARWLVGKEARRSGDWQVRNPGVEASGWYFQFKNEFYPDVDDTAAVLMALRRAALDDVRGGADAVRRGLAWTLSLQCTNGGWAAFDVDVDHEILTKVPFADHNAMLDPACADITGRVLEMLGEFPEEMARPEVRAAVARAAEYLAREQDPSGAWYGRWGVNYIYGTCHALKGLAAAGVDPASETIRRAVAWLVSCQNEDGGWGESCASYEDPAAKGRGASTPSQTAWAVMGLVAAGEAPSIAVTRGIRFLIDTQRPDGSWAEEQCTGTGFPGVFYLRYHLYCQYFPLFALGAYRRAMAGERRAERTGGAKPEDTLVAGVDFRD